MDDSSFAEQARKQKRSRSDSTRQSVRLFRAIHPTPVAFVARLRVRSSCPRIGDTFQQDRSRTKRPSEFPAHLNMVFLEYCLHNSINYGNSSLRYYDFNVWTDEKRIEKLRYMHRNPLRRGLVEKPEDWPWSSFRHYASGVEGTVEIESIWTAWRREHDDTLSQNRDLGHPNLLVN